MMNEEIIKPAEAVQPIENTHAIAVPGEWVMKKLLGPTLDVMGQQLAVLYQNGVNLIAEAANRKLLNKDDGATANLRVTRDVFWNGAFTNEAICAEYFGGALASSRSNDGKDDAAIYYVDIIKSLSSKQLLLHYILYRSLNKLILSDSSKQNTNIGLSTDLDVIRPIFATVELVESCGTDPANDLVVLFSKGLIKEYKMNSEDLGENKKLPFSEFVPTTLGVQLFAIANNRFAGSREFPKIDFGDFPGIRLPTYYALSIIDLKNMINSKS